MKAINYLILIFFLNGANAQGRKVIYKYKQYEKFDFENLGVDVNKAGIGDLSVHPRFSSKYKNKLPQKPNFNKELIDSVDYLP
jgi:hypothetical protein